MIAKTLCTLLATLGFVASAQAQGIEDFVGVYQQSVANDQCPDVLEITSPAAHQIRLVRQFLHPSGRYMDWGRDNIGPIESNIKNINQGQFRLRDNVHCLAGYPCTPAKHTMNNRVTNGTLMSNYRINGKAQGETILSLSPRGESLTFRAHGDHLDPGIDNICYYDRVSY